MSWSDHEIKKHSNYESDNHEKMYLLISKLILIHINRLDGVMQLSKIKHLCRNKSCPFYPRKWTLPTPYLA